MCFTNMAYYNYIFMLSVCDFWVLEGITNVTIVPLFNCLAKVNILELASLHLKEEESTEVLQRHVKFP